jgi:hypothetical protein
MHPRRDLLQLRPTPIQQGFQGLDAQQSLLRYSRAALPDFAQQPL